jgi:hypothetical protein
MYQYGYSIWGPSFAAKLQLTATDSNLIVRNPKTVL